MTNPLHFVSRQNLDAAAARLQIPQFISATEKKNEELYIEGNPNKGFKWSALAKYGVVEISQKELFARPEFEDMTNGEKVIYAFDLGWRYNPDCSMWQRIKGH